MFSVKWPGGLPLALRFREGLGLAALIEAFDGVFGEELICSVSGGSRAALLVSGVARERRWCFVVTDEISHGLTLKRGVTQAF